MQSEPHGAEPLTDAELLLVEQDAEHGGFGGDADAAVRRLLATVRALQARLEAQPAPGCPICGECSICTWTGGQPAAPEEQS